MNFQAFMSIIIILLTSLLVSCNGASDNNSSPSTLTNTLLYSSNSNGHNELYRLAGGVEQLLLSDPDYDYWWPKVSPDQSGFLVYRSPVNPQKNHDHYSNADLMFFDRDGNNPKTLISKGQYGWLAQGVSRWSKDGSKILMAAEQNTNGSMQWRLVITNSQGENPKNLSDWWIIDPNFSPDNRSVVFIAFPENNLSFDLTKLELHIADFDALSNTLSNIVRLTHNNTRDHDPSYSPDVSKIVFSAGNATYTNVDIALYDVNTGLESRLVDDNAANGGSMDWSKNGSFVYFHSLDLTAHPFRIKKVNISTLTVHTILQSAANDFSFFHPEVL